MDALAIADALATRYKPAHVTPPTVNAQALPNIRESTARLPNAIPTSPWVLVILPNGQAILAPSVVDYSLEYHVLFHYAKHSGDVARDMTALLAWIGVLMTQTYADMDLGVTGVKKAYPTEFRLTVETYGGQEYYGWDITVMVDFQEAQAMTA